MKINRQTSATSGKQFALCRRRRLARLYLEDGDNEDQADFGRSLVDHLHKAGCQLRAREQLDVRNQHARRVRRRSRYVPGDVDRICHAFLLSLGLGLSRPKIRGGAITLSAITDRA